MMIYDDDTDENVNKILQEGCEEEGGCSSDSYGVGISKVLQFALIYKVNDQFSFASIIHKKTRSDISEGGRSSRLRNPEFAAKHKVRFLSKHEMKFRSKFKVGFLYFRTF